MTLKFWDRKSQLRPTWREGAENIWYLNTEVENETSTVWWIGFEGNIWHVRVPEQLTSLLYVATFCESMRSIAPYTRACHNVQYWIFQTKSDSKKLVSSEESSRQRSIHTTYHHFFPVLQKEQKVWSWIYLPLLGRGIMPKLFPKT